MTTKKQIEANRKNALQSTGAVTEEGKAIVSKNAVKHGIFTKDLIITSGDGKEKEEEYREMLNNLVESLNPEGQMEHLLVEKIAVDFWRLRRVLRFETGSIRNHLDMAVYNYYNATDWLGKKDTKTNMELDEGIAKQKKHLDWNNTYIKCLKKGIVSFGKPTWEGEGLRSDIKEDLYAVCEKVMRKEFNQEDYKKYRRGKLGFEELKAILKNAGYADSDIAEELIECLKKQSKGYEKKIRELEIEKLKNKLAEEVNIKLRSLPSRDHAEKVMRYEKAIQKSIFQNLAVLKKLQSIP